jgi:excisionase family DNA binding protein
VTLDAVLREVVRDVVREELRAVLREPLVGATGGVATHQEEEERGDGGLWDASRASSFLGVSTSWVYHRAAAGTIPCIRVGHNLRFDPEALRAWVRGERRGGRVVPLK